MSSMAAWRSVLFEVWDETIEAAEETLIKNKRETRTQILGIIMPISQVLNGPRNK